MSKISKSYFTLIIYQLPQKPHVYFTTPCRHCYCVLYCADRRHTIALTPINALEIHFNWIEIPNLVTTYASTQLILKHFITYLSRESIFKTLHEKYLIHF